MNKRQTLLFDILSSIDEDNGCRTKLIAGIFYGNKLVALGFNRRKSHPFANLYRKNDFAIYLHAETDAIHKAISKGINLEKSIISILRLDDDGKIKISKPCIGCERAIVEFNLWRVEWTNTK